MLDFQMHGDVALLKLDDGKANAVSHALIDAVNEGLDRAEADARAAVVTGRPGVFSAGFDLKEIAKGPEAANALVTRGGQMLLRMFCHPQPLVGASTGHAIAAGAFMMLSCDTRIAAAGDFKTGLNETAIDMVLPVFGLELASARLSMRYLTRSVIQAELYSPEDGMAAGFSDEVVPADAVEARALEVAAELAKLPTGAYAGNKLKIRASTIETIRASLPS